jgi:hypothetical protein
MTSRRTEHPSSALAIGSFVTIGAVVAAAVCIGAGRLVLLAAIAIVAYAVIASRPQRAILVLAAVAPFDGLLLVIPAPSFLAGWKEALLLGAWAVALRRGVHHLRSRRAPAWLLPAAILTALSAVSATHAGGYAGLVGLKVSTFWLLLGVLAWAFPLDQRERDRLVTILISAGAVVAAVGVAQQVIGADRLHSMGYKYNSVIRFVGGTMRSWSTFTQPFPFAFYVMLVVLVGLPVSMAAPRRLRSRLFFVALPLYALGMVFALVRTAWIALLVGLAYLAVTRLRQLLSVAPVFLGGALLVLMASTGLLVTNSGFARLHTWESNIGTAMSHPLGTGVGSTGAAGAKVVRTKGGVPTFDPAQAGPAVYVLQPDNYWLKMLFELGVLGLWLFCVVLAGAIGDARRAARLPGLDGALGAGIAAFLVASAVAAVLSTYFEIFPIDLHVWLLAGVASALVADRADALHRPRQSARVAAGTGH